MIDLEKVINGLKTCIGMTTLRGCTGCPYNDLAEENCQGALMADALELIEREARVLALDEVRELKPGTVVWKETLLDVFPVEFWKVDLFEFPDGVKAVMVKFSQGMDYEKDYNRVYRLWTAKPTVEQRKEEEWGWKSQFTS